VSVVIVGVIRRKPVLTHASIVCEGMLASVNSVNKTLAGWSVCLSCRPVDVWVVKIHSPVKC